jgi:hypothetical protein
MARVGRDRQAYVLHGVVIMRFEGERIAEYWGQSDVLSILQELGVVPGDVAWSSAFGGTVR